MNIIKNIKERISAHFEQQRKRREYADRAEIINAFHVGNDATGGIYLVHGDTAIKWFPSDITVSEINEALTAAQTAADNYYTASH